MSNTYRVPGTTGVLSPMIEALGLEVAAVRRRGGSMSYDLSGGERIAESEGRFLYKFAVDGDLQIRDDTPVHVKAGFGEADGIIVSLYDGVLVVALDRDFGPTILSAKLTTDDSFLIQALREKLEKVKSGEASHNRSAAHRVMGLVPPHIADGEIAAGLFQGQPPLNEDQQQAVRRSLGSDMLFVWGPPGTGKTTTVARIVEGHYRAGRSVLLVSNTNIAVDTALEMVADRLSGDPDFHAGAVIRHGPIAKEELEQNYGDAVVLDKVVERLSKEVNGDLGTVKRDIAAEEAQLQAQQAVLNDLLAVESLKRELAANRSSLRDIADDIETARAQERMHSATYRNLVTDLERAKGMGTVRRFLLGLNPERLAREATAVEVQVKAVRGALAALKSRAQDARSALERADMRLREALAATASHPPIERCRADLATADNRMKELLKKRMELEQRLQQIRQEVINRCRIMATTVYRTYLKGQIERKFDVVVIDEASMLMLPMSYYAAGLAEKSVTVAGDFRQLGPIVMSDDKAAEDWLKQDVFFKAGVPKSVSGGTLPSHIVRLGVQYRMCEPICAAINTIVYDGQLRTCLSNRPLTRVASFLPGPLVLLDTSRLHPWAAYKPGSFTRYNLLHAVLIKKLIAHMVGSGILPKDGALSKEIGVVSPFAAQSRVIQAMLEDSFGEHARGVSATVHRFQGNEKTAMFVDLTDSPGSWLSRFLKANSLEEDGARLLNVAVSRAKDQVVLVANVDYLRNQQGTGRIVHQLLDFYEKNGYPLDVETILPLGGDDWTQGLHAVMPPGFDVESGETALFNEASFYRAFAKDMAEARESVVIFSPFLTERGAGRWADHLRGAMARGVHVRVVTRPPSEFGGGSPAEAKSAIEALRDMGVIVDLRDKMHEKVAIIDDSSTWHGSLNILSHVDTHESMLRLDGPSLCQQLARCLSTPVPGRKEGEAKFFDRENPECPDCGALMVWKNGRYGIYFECPSCHRTVDVGRRGSRRGGAGKTGKSSGGGTGKPTSGKRCPDCGKLLVKRNGRHGPFLGCSGYPDCRHTEDLD